MHEVRMGHPYRPYRMCGHMCLTGMPSGGGCVCGRGGTKHGLTRAAVGRVLLFYTNAVHASEGFLSNYTLRIRQTTEQKLTG